jgi:flagellar protein FliO/FliZ
LDFTQYVRFAAALAGVVGLILLLGWIVRRRGWATALGGTGGTRRLAVVETLPIDARHRLVLVRRDQMEHLLLLGPNGATVVEQGTVPAVEPTP